MSDRSLVEVVEVHHNGIHHKKLGVRIERNYRETWCSLCGKAVVWERSVLMKICIHHNDETGEPLWSVCDENHFDNWINSYKTLKSAHAMVIRCEHDEPKVVCSIQNCTGKHSLTGVGADR